MKQARAALTAACGHRPRAGARHRGGAAARAAGLAAQPVLREPQRCSRKRCHSSCSRTTTKAWLSSSRVNRHAGAIRVTSRRRLVLRLQYAMPGDTVYQVVNHGAKERHRTRPSTPPRRPSRSGQLEHPVVGAASLTRAAPPEADAQRSRQRGRSSCSVAAQLRRPPRAIRAVAHRCPCGNPDVVETSPALPDGTPFPTLYYLTCPKAASAIGTP